MSATAASVGQGAQFWTGIAGSPIAYTALLEITSVMPPEETVEQVDATHLMSPSHAKEYIPAGVFDAGVVEISGSYLGDTTQEAVATLIEAGTTFPWKVTSGGNIGGTKVCTITGLGFFTKFKRGPFEVGKKNEVSATLKVTGPITVAIA